MPPAKPRRVRQPPAYRNNRRKINNDPVDIINAENRLARVYGYNYNPELAYLWNGWRGAANWEAVLANPNAYSRTEIRNELRKVINYVLRKQRVRYGEFDNLGPQDKALRDRMFRRRITNMINLPQFQNFIGLGYVNPRRPRQLRPEDPLWYWDYGKVHVGGKNRQLRDARQNAANARYKAYLRDAMKRAAAEWTRLNPDAVISHGIMNGIFKISRGAMPNYF